MTTALITHLDCLSHVTPPGHPEQVARLEYILKILEDEAFNDLMRLEAPIGEEAEILRCHPESYMQKVRASVPDEGQASLDADTHVSPGSLDAALRGVGAVCKAVDLVMAGEAQNVFCAMRPPGHHAERETAMGFCFFGNVAIAAKRALDHHGLKRVAVVDFDVHHGNGTQDLLWDEARALFVSTHQMPLYPGTGDRHETGAHNNIMNIPLPPGAGGSEFRTVIEGMVLPALDDFAPELVLISAGFDAHAADPLANLNLTERDFSWVTQVLCDVADRHAKGRVVSTLEGGYDLDALAASVVAHVKVLMERGR